MIEQNVGNVLILLNDGSCQWPAPMKSEPIRILFLRIGNRLGEDRSRRVAGAEKEDADGF